MAFGVNGSRESGVGSRNPPYFWRKGGRGEANGMYFLTLTVFKERRFLDQRAALNHCVLMFDAAKK
ncbi:MAG: hypothetical protein F6J94_28660 [Moorea sp. SIO1F2]|uniref:hypothetical protein n=1 Tax=unclassified Moorena TaxID=2683338 RepID=UPI0013B6C21D|nr:MULTISPECIES: hypothetical protein [unclassified Moorena]NEP22776.1 hypothetical protein [Moorena sp. SIO3I6]NET85723.1 hypothetical protein [Moorena sp. SIO1F2]